MTLRGGPPRGAPALLGILLLCGHLHAEPSRAADPVELLTAAVAATLPSNLGLVEVTPPHLPSSAWLGTISVDWKSPPRAGRQTVLIHIRDGARSLGHGYAWVELQSKRPVLVTRRALHIGDVVSASDFTLEARPIAANQGLDIDPSLLVGSRVERALDIGQVVMDGDLRRPPPVAAGTPVRVEVRRGLVRVYAQGVLERAAKIGEAVVVRLTEGKREVHGRLVGPGLVVNEGE